MRYGFRFLPLLILAYVSGCAASAEQRLAIANDTFASTLDALSDAREAGQISDETQLTVIAPARRTVNALLDRAYDAVASGEKLKLVTILAEIDKELSPLLRQRFLLKQREEN